MRDEILKVVSVLDPAIDTSKVTVAEYNEYLADRDFARIAPLIIPGEHPTIYYVREIPGSLWDSYVHASSEAAAPLMAFRCGLVRVENLWQGDGTRVPEWKPRADNGKPTALTDAEAELFKPSVRAEIGAVALTHSFLERRIVGCFRLPAMLAPPLVERTYRRAEPNRKTAEGTSNGGRLEATSPNPEGTDPPKATGDAATA